MITRMSMMNMILASQLLVFFICVIAEAHARKTLYTDDGICKRMVETQGYTCEEHKVTTVDGYILSLQRMPAGRSGKAADKPPVLLQHGLFIVGCYNMVVQHSGRIIGIYLSGQRL
ncbi:Triacylglycerol lipase [Arachis hypogaea]|nr:Triacylglycerol lipase [Arachis hypogaea]